MATNATAINDAILCNQINKKGFIMANKGKKIKREIMLSNYTQETINDCWESLTINVIHNYEKGRGTVIKGFGTFTYKRQFVNLEGTTNEYFRDKREDEPVFIVSKDLNKCCMPGEYTQLNTIKYYTQKENKNIPLIPLNFSEIAYRLSMSKDEVQNIITNLIRNIGDSISEGKFKNKIFPNLGVLLIKYNIIAMKFNEDFVEKIKDKNPKLIKSKKIISLDTDINLNETGQSKNFLKTVNSFFNNGLRANHSLNTKIDISCHNYLKTRYDIDITKFPNHVIRNIYKNYNDNNGTINFINDYNPIKTRNRQQNGEINEIMNSPIFTLDEETISNFEYYKGILVFNAKKFDKNKCGTITKEEAINSLIHSNISDKIDFDFAEKVVDYYNKTEKIEYMKFIAKIINDVQNYLNNKYLKSDLINSEVNKETLYNLKSNWTNNKKILNKMNKSCSNDFFPSRKLNISKSSVDIKESNNKNILPIIKSKKKIITNLRYIKEETKNDYLSNNPSLETERKPDILNSYQNLEEIKSMIKNIKLIIPDLKIKYLTLISQNISSYEFLNILKKFNISYPINNLDSFLSFIGIKDTKSFSLKDFILYVKNCKVVETKLDKKDLNTIINKLKDIIFINGGINFLFKNGTNDTLSCDNFIKILKEKTDYESEQLKDIFYFLVKTDRNFTLDDYFKYFENDKKDLNETDYVTNMKLIINEINNKHLTPDEYFNHLLSYNISTKDKFITRINWIKYLQKEKINLTAKDCDNLFIWIDTKKDNLIDMDEFISKYNFTTKPLTVFKDIIYNNKLDIEDLAHKMNMSLDEIKQLNYEEFKNKIKKVDNTLSDSFIKSIFDELNKKNNTKLLEQKNFLKEINYRKEDYYEQNKNKYLIQKYREAIIKKTNYEELKKLFEERDGPSLGVLTKGDYVSAISKVIPEFTDDEHMIYVRVNDAFDKLGDNIIYSKILNSIFFFVPEKQNDEFIKLCQILTKILADKCDNDIEKLIIYISQGIIKKSSFLGKIKPLTLEQISKFLKDKYNQNISDKAILKLDVDSDGLISYEDMKSILKRYSLTSFFKYTNEVSNPQINFYTKENLPKDKIISIIKNLYNYMKLKNISETGLFKKLDKNGDGFISNIEFNEEMVNILKLSSDIKDQFFNFLDFYHNGMIDLTTFISRLTNIDNNYKLNFLSQNNNKIENKILDEFKLFCQKNKDFSDSEIYEIIDKDCDGIINIKDFENFVINILKISKEEFNLYNLERVMMTLSLSKNLQVGINDIKEFINISNGKKDHMNIKQIFKITSNQNLSELKKNKEWINDIIERFGMFISEKYDSIEQFFDKYTVPGSGKFRFEDFMKFQEENLELFQNGFNLSKDEIVAIFTSLDSQKKNYLTKKDLENKLQIFNFYTKMHIDIKNFLKQNFENSSDAFKYFIKQKKYLNDNKNNSYEEDKNNNNEKNNNYSDHKYSISLKEFFDTLENFFPKKYSTDTILKYLNKYFKITIPSEKSSLTEKKENINFDEFNYVYFDKIEENIKFISTKNNPIKLVTNRFSFSNEIRQNLLKRSSSFVFSQHLNKSNQIKKKLMNLNSLNYVDNLSTPFDFDPLNKIKRLIISSKYNLTKFFENMALKADNNFLLNKFQFRTMIKDFKIGLTNKEIDFIISKCGKASYDGKINFRDFIKFLKGQNNILKEGNKNIAKFIGEIKSLIYKYYSNPIICFQNNDEDHSCKMDFEKFKNIIFDMYTRDNHAIPNFILIKNAYDTLDLRKDGLIDIKEWCIAFASYNSKLDIDEDKIPNGQEFFNNNKINNNAKTINIDNNNSFEHNRIILREWETSGDVVDIYVFIHKNRKMIKNKIYESDYTVTSGNENFIHSENLIHILKDFLPNQKLSQIQWKMIVNIAQNENYNNLIDIQKFFRIVEITGKNLLSQPKVLNTKNNDSNKIRRNKQLIRDISMNSLISKDNTINNSISRLRKFSCKTNLYQPKVNMVNMINFQNVVLPGENKKIKKMAKKYYNKSVG